MHCTSFTGILVVDYIIEVGEISVHKLPISRQRAEQTDAQQGQTRRSDFHDFWSDIHRSSWAAERDRGSVCEGRWRKKKKEKKEKQQQTKSVGEKLRRIVGVIVWHTRRGSSHVSILLQWSADGQERSGARGSQPHTDMTGIWSSARCLTCTHRHSAEQRCEAREGERARATLRYQQRKGTRVNVPKYLV